mgnify:CR=1 FL=1
MPVLNHWLKKEQRFILLFTLSSRWLKASSDPLWTSNRTARSVRTEQVHCMQWIATSFTSFSPRNDMCVRVVSVPYTTIPFTPCHREGVARGDPLWADNRRDNSSASSRHDGLPRWSLEFPPRNDKKALIKKVIFAQYSDFHKNLILHWISLLPHIIYQNKQNIRRICYTS